MLKKQQQIKIQYYNKIKNEQNNKQPLQEIKQENDD